MTKWKKRGSDVDLGDLILELFSDFYWTRRKKEEEEDLTNGKGNAHDGRDNGQWAEDSGTKQI